MIRVSRERNGPRWARLGIEPATICQGSGSSFRCRRRSASIRCFRLSVRHSLSGSRRSRRLLGLPPDRLSYVQCGALGCPRCCFAGCMLCLLDTNSTHMNMLAAETTPGQRYYTYRVLGAIGCSKCRFGGCKRCYYLHRDEWLDMGGEMPWML